MSGVRNVAVAQVPGIRGTQLSADMVERLPAGAPPAPWRLRGTGLMWLAPAPPAARAALQPGITNRPLAVGGMFVSYEQTPVGPYDELVGFIALAQRWAVTGHIPFIAVDSPASVVGGRANWSLPKTLAEFSGKPARDQVMRARHDEWKVAARARPLGPGLATSLRFTLVQAEADCRRTRSSGRARVRARPALVQVHARGVPELTGWLRSGRHPGLIIERFDGELSSSVRGPGPTSR